LISNVAKGDGGGLPEHLQYISNLVDIVLFCGGAPGRDTRIIFVNDDRIVYLWVSLLSDNLSEWNRRLAAATLFSFWRSFCQLKRARTAARTYSAPETIIKSGTSQSGAFLSSSPFAIAIEKSINVDAIAKRTVIKGVIRVARGQTPAV
jgi:hypothetical protein